MNYVYLATFTPNKNGGYSVVFPDFESCFTEGKEIEDALYMARDVLSIYIDTMEELKQSVPVASAVETVAAPVGGLVVPIDIDISIYRRKQANRAIRRTVSLPSWLDAAAEEAGLSLSQVMQDSIRAQLGIADR